MNSLSDTVVFTRIAANYPRGNVKMVVTLNESLRLLAGYIAPQSVVDCAEEVADALSRLDRDANVYGQLFQFVRKEELPALWAANIVVSFEEEVSDE